MLSKPERGPKENVNVWFPSASVMYPSPPETSWHLICPPLLVIAPTVIVAVPVPVVERVRERVTNLAGLKVSETPFDRVRPYLDLGLSIFIGNEPLIAQAVAAAEISGSVSAVASVFPEAIRALLDDPTPERAAAREMTRRRIRRENPR